MSAEIGSGRLSALEPNDVAALTSALVAANDQLLGLYDLALAASNTLDERTAVVDVLTRSSRLLSTDAMVLHAGDDTVGIGSPVDRRRLEAPDARRQTGHGNRDAAGHDVTFVDAVHASGLHGALGAVRHHAPFSTGDRKMLTAVLRTALGAMSTARLHQQVLRRALDSQDRTRASEIAQLALPSWRPDLEGIELFVANEPAQETGGDLFAFWVDGSDLCFAVGDVSGKGLPAAVMMTTAICAANAAFRDPALADPADQLKMISQWTHDHLSEAGLFLTLFIGRFQSTDGVLRWTSAGHSPCLVLRRTGDSPTPAVTELPPQTPPLGVLPHLTPRTEMIELATGDMIAIGSDGLVEQENGRGEPFGDQRLHDGLMPAVSIDQARSVERVGRDLLSAIDRFADGRSPFDDRTLLLLRRMS